MNLSNRIDKEYFTPKQPTFADKQPITHNYSMAIFWGMLLATIFVGLFAYFSQVLVTGEGYLEKANYKDVRCADTRFTAKYKSEVLGLRC